MASSEALKHCRECGHVLHPDPKVQLEMIGPCPCACHPWNGQPQGDDDAKPDLVPSSHRKSTRV